MQIFENAERVRGNWSIPHVSNLSRELDKHIGKNVINFATTGLYDSAVALQMEQVLDLVLSVDVRLRANSSLMVAVQNRETKHTYNVHYVVADVMLTAQDDNFYYGLGPSCDCWRHLTRDLLIDVQKGIQQVMSGASRASGANISPALDKLKRKLRRTDVKVTSVSFLGSGSFDNLTFATTEHIAQFYDAADWFVRNQVAKTGGWPNPVRRKLSEFAELKQGWYSAMGQGHAISLLARAYFYSNGDPKYLRAAINGMKPFRVPSRQGGVLAKFLGKYDWYEEYPTTPASFVLNGFIYSLLGLYDLKMTGTASAAREAAQLYDQGMASLKKMLLLYDTGSGSIYDLRHVTLGMPRTSRLVHSVLKVVLSGVEPNLARWDYHATHVNQLLLLATIDRDPLISRTAERWRSYMSGKRAPHN